MSKSLDEILNGSVIILDKHAGPTSHQVSGWLRDMLNLKKVGHTGTLDPMVTGVLPVILGNSVKAMPLFAGSQKEYVGVMRLHQDVPRERVEEVVKDFIGKIMQRPPKKSAVARREREREIFTFDILDFQGRDVLFRTRCEAGTYIRKLCHDIGQSLGVGAHMSELRRTSAGSFTEADSHSLTEVKDLLELYKSGENKDFLKILIPIEKAVQSSKKVYANETAVDNIRKGAPLFVMGVHKCDDGIIRGETVAILSERGRMVAVGIAKMDSKEMSSRKKGTAVRTDRVF